MPDGTSIFGTDTSRYQPLGTYDPGAFEIFNVEDPQLADKADARAGKIPWGVYLWVYPGHDLGADTRWLIETTRALGHSEPPAGYWFDYEQAGVTPDQLAAAFTAADDAAVRAGYYSGPHALDHAAFLDRSWWNAAYPTGAEEFPGYASLWASSRPRPMQIWQYTSAGGLDRNVVVDEAWWATWTSTTEEPAPRRRKGSRMELVISPTRALTHLGGVLDAVIPNPTDRVPAPIDIPKAAQPIMAANPGMEITHVGEATYDRLLAKLTGDAPPVASVDLSELKATKAAFDAAFAKLGA